MQKTGFTIMEVVISIVIISIVGVTVLGSSSNYTKLFHRIEKNSIDFEILSVVGINNSKTLHNATRTLKDLATSNFVIKNDLVLDYLKANEFLYTEKEPTSNLSARETSVEAWAKELSKEVSSLQFGITKITVSGDQTSGILFTIREITH